MWVSETPPTSQEEITMQNFIVILSWIFPIAGFIAPFVINHYMVKRKREEYKKDVGQSGEGERGKIAK